MNFLLFTSPLFTSALSLRAGIVGQSMTIVADGGFRVEMNNQKGQGDNVVPPWFFVSVGLLLFLDKARSPHCILVIVSNFIGTIDRLSGARGALSLPTRCFSELDHLLSYRFRY